MGDCGNTAVTGSGTGTDIEYIAAGVDGDGLSLYRCDVIGVTVAVPIAAVFHLPPAAGFFHQRNEATLFQGGQNRAAGIWTLPHIKIPTAGGDCPNGRISVSGNNLPGRDQRSGQQNRC